MDTSVIARVWHVLARVQKRIVFFIRMVCCVWVRARATVVVKRELVVCKGASAVIGYCFEVVDGLGHLVRVSYSNHE